MVQIGVLTTYDRVTCAVADMARSLGRALAERGCVVLTGGNGGLMTIISQAVVEAKGTTVGVIAYEVEDVAPDHELFNPYNSIIIKTGQTLTARSSILVRSSDAVILVAGGVGSLTEVAIAYNLKKPIVVLSGSGMMADKMKAMFPDGYLDHRAFTKINFAESPERAAELAIELANKRRC